MLSADSDAGAQLFPYPPVEKLKVLGVIRDTRMSFDQHFTNIIARAKVRRGILRRVGGHTWGAETSILRTTSRALVES